MKNSNKLAEIKKKIGPDNIAIITTDHINKVPPVILDVDYTGKLFYGEPQPGAEIKKFKLYDDDHELYYSGYFYDDDYAENQDRLLAWGMYDSGCTEIKVAPIGSKEFVAEIG